LRSVLTSETHSLVACKLLQLADNLACMQLTAEQTSAILRSIATVSTVCSRCRWLQVEQKVLLVVPENGSS
jgi:hypothetical protein